MIMEERLFELYGRTYETNEMIFCEFEPGDEVFIIKSGKVKISKVEQMNEKILAILGAGEIFGEMAIIDETVRSATATTTEKTEVLALNKHNFRDILAKKPEFLVKLIKILCNRIKFTVGQTRNMSIKSPEGRVADMLYLLSETYKKNQEQITDIIIDITPEEIGQMTGVELDEVNKVLEAFKKQFLIRIETETIEIINQAEIKNKAGLLAIRNSV